MVAYMDDITIVCTDSHSIAMATKVVNDYCAATGTLVNRGQSELFLSQDWHKSLTTSFPVKTETIKLLVVTVQRDRGGSLNWEKTMCHIQQKICEWSAQSLTMTGKILVLKAIVLTILLYLGRRFPIQCNQQEDRMHDVHLCLWKPDEMTQAQNLVQSS